MMLVWQDARNLMSDGGFPILINVSIRTPATGLRTLAGCLGTADRTNKLLLESPPSTS